mgnify:CR=1 FL=1
MELSFTDKKKIRKSFGKLENIVNIPDLIEVQKKSYDSFLQLDKDSRSGLEKVFQEVFPIEDFAGLATIEYVKYRFEKEKYDVAECKQRGLTYSAPLKATLRLVAYDVNDEQQTKQILSAKEQEVYMGEVPMMTHSGTFITNGVYADFYVVAAKTDPEKGNKGMSMFLLDKEFAGISANKLNKLGWRASDTAELAFDNVKVPVENLLGEEGMGFNYIMQHFALERLIMGVNAHARSEFALEYTMGYMQEREAFGRSLDKFQALRHTIAEMVSEVEVIKEFNYATTQRLNDGEYVVKEASMSKLLATKISDEVMYKCLQMLGGYGYMEDYPMARMFRDSRLGPIGGGTSEILKEIIAKMVIDKKEYKPAAK